MAEYQAGLGLTTQDKAAILVSWATPEAWLEKDSCMDFRKDPTSGQQRRYYGLDNQPLPRQGYSVEEVGQICGWSRSTSYRLIKDGKLKAIKIRGRRIISSEAVAVLLREGA